MDIEIRTTTESWIAQVDDELLGDAEAGSGAAYVRGEIQAGRPLAVREGGAEPQPTRPAPSHLAVFNPGNVVAIVEKVRLRRAARSRGLGGL